MKQHEIDNHYSQLRLIAEEKASYKTTSKQGDNVKIFTKESLIQELKEIQALGWVRNGRPGNAGGVGNTLEDLLGITENNLPIPNATEWELKCQRINTSSLVTLFHMEPSPRALKFVPQIFLPLYGWPHQEAGLRYDLLEMSFRQTISGHIRSDRGFMIDVDRKNQKVLVTFDSRLISTTHEDWKNQIQEKGGLNELNPQPYWGFSDLNNKAGTKLLNCFFVQAESKKEAGVEYFRYSKMMILREFNFDGFLSGIEQGYVYIDFDARTAIITEQNSD